MTILAACEAVTVGYRSRVLATNLTWQIESGSFWGIVGPNGAGKTTLLRTLTGALPPLAGRVHRSEARIAYVPQKDRYNPLVPLSVLDVVVMGLYGTLAVGRRPGLAEWERASIALAQLEMADVAHERFTQLSGGQQQRVLIARALVADPNLLILDEPTTGLDLVAESDLHDRLAQIRREQNLAVIMVSHSLDAVARNADNVVLLARGQAEIGTVARLLTDDTLTRLYGRPIRAPRLDGAHG